MKIHLVILATAAIFTVGCGADEMDEEFTDVDSAQSAIGEATCGQLRAANQIQATPFQIQSLISPNGYQNSVPSCKNAFVVGITAAAPPFVRVSTSIVWEAGNIPAAQCASAVMEAFLYQNGLQVAHIATKGIIRPDGTCKQPRLAFAARTMDQFSNTTVAANAKLGATFKALSVRAISVH